MVKGTKKTRKTSKATSRRSVLTIPELRKAFDHMDRTVESLRKTAAHSFSDAVVHYREEWRKVFKRDLSPADAAAYLKFRFGIKSGKTRRRHTRGGQRGGAALGGAPLDYGLRPGVAGVYGQFPTYQTQGLDRYYQDSLTADCGKPNGFPTSGDGASQSSLSVPKLDQFYQTQKGGGAFDALFRPLAASAPVGTAYQSMMEFKGVTPFPSSDPVGNAPLRMPQSSYLTKAQLDTSVRTYSSDVYSGV
jgi:hypothetical protein